MCQTVQSVAVLFLFVIKDEKIGIYPSFYTYNDIHAYVVSG